MAITERARTWWDGAGQRLPPTVLGVFLAFVGGLRRIDPFDRAMTLAAQAFTSLFPLVIAVAAIRSSDSDDEKLAASVSGALSLPPASEEVLEQALPASGSTATSLGFLGLFLILVSATSFSRALTRMYARVWEVGYPGLSGWWRWFAVLLAVGAVTVALTAAHGRIGRGPVATVGELTATFLLTSVLWTWVPWLLLAGAVAPRRLLPGGCLMGLGSIFTSVASDLYLPRALAGGAAHFGAFGVAFTYIGWLFAVAMVLILATVLGSALVRGDVAGRSALTAG